MKTNIVALQILIFVGLLLAITQCGQPLRVYSDHDRSVHVEDYSTFNWLSADQIEDKNNPLLYNELNDKRIKKVVNDELASRGYILSDKPELLLHYHIVVEDKTSLRTDPYGYYYSPYWMRTNVNVFQYKEGTLILDLMDASTNNLIWRGWVVPFLEDSIGEKQEDEIRKAVMMIFSKFPYRERKTNEGKPTNW
jgi:hypothetical protein